MGKYNCFLETIRPFDTSTRYRKNLYVGMDEILRGRLEARLGKPNAECIIC